MADTAERRIPGFCALCKSRCGSVMVTRDGVFVGQEPNPEHPTGKALCVKGKAAPEMIYNAQRLLHPVMRTRPKGDPDPGWRRISWDEALDRTAAELDALRRGSGPESVAFGLTTPSGTAISDDLRWIDRFTHAFGSPNVAYGTEICNWHKDHAHGYTFGRGVGSPEFEMAGCVLLWGHNPSATWLDHATKVAAAKGRGAKLVVVDPRRAGFASRADQWLRVRPGADGALALGLARAMIRHGWFDEAFVRDWSNGPLLVRTDTGRFLRAGDLAVPPDGAAADDLLACDEATGALLPYRPSTRRYLADAPRPQLEAGPDVALAAGRLVPCRSAFALFSELCDAYTPEAVERIAWIPAAQVEATAKLLHEAGPVCYYAWSGVGQHTNATQTDRAIACLIALTGSFDAPGGNVQHGKLPAADVSGADLLSAEQRAKCIGFGRSALGPARDGWIGTDTLYDAVLDGRPYPIRGLVGFGRNFLVNHANVRRGSEALAKLAFHVQADLVMTPTAAYADIVLPICTPWERAALRVGFEGSARAEHLVQFRQAAIAPLGESRSDAFVVFELAKRLGFGSLFWNGDVEAGLDHVLAPTGLTLNDLRRQPNGVSIPVPTPYRTYREAGFRTPTGKVELFSETFRDNGQDALPVFVEPALSPDGPLGERFPLVLTSAKVVHFRHGQDRHVPSLRRRLPDPELALHPDTAATRGIAEGEWLTVRTPEAAVRFKARFDDSLHPRVVCGQYGWWQGNDALRLAATEPLSDRDASFNSLISDRYLDPISGSAPLRSYLCEVEAAKGCGSRPGHRYPS